MPFVFAFVGFSFPLGSFSPIFYHDTDLFAFFARRNEVKLMVCTVSTCLRKSCFFLETFLTQLVSNSGMARLSGCFLAFFSIMV